MREQYECGNIPLPRVQSTLSIIVTTVIKKQWFGIMYAILDILPFIQCQTIQRTNV